MFISIENNQCIVNLDETEFPVFEAMFANLQLGKKVSVEFRKFPNIGGKFSWHLLPMHLCRTIGEGRHRPTAEGSDQTIFPSDNYWRGSSQASILSAGFSREKSSPMERIGRSPLSTDACRRWRPWAMEEVFHCETWADASAMIKAGLVVPTGSKCPDFVCTFPDGSLGIFEAKGTTGTVSALTQSLKDGKYQAFALDTQSPIKHRVVVGTALGEPVTKVILMDPPPLPPPGDRNDDVPNDDDWSLSEAETPDEPNDDDWSLSEGNRSLSGVETNLSAPLVRDAARGMRKFPSKKRGGAEGDGVCIPAQTETIFRGPHGEIALTNEFKPEKKHGWLEINS
jgi:hypothetical protein